jgi:1-phosphofructokinase
LKARGVRVAVDQDNEALREMIQIKPFFIKPNEHELRELMSLSDTEIVTLCGAAWSLVRFGIEHVVVSLGERGALFADKDGILLGSGPRVEAVSTVGAGDALTAAYLYTLACEKPREDAVRLAVATASAKVTCPGSSPPTRAAVESYMPKIKIQSINE